LSGANMNWASPAYVGLSVFVTAWLWEHGRRWLYAGVVVNLLLLSVAYHYHPLAEAFGVEPTSRQTPYKHRIGWRELGEQVRDWSGRYPDARLLGDERGLLSYLSYYGVDAPREVVSWNPSGRINSHFDLAADIAATPQGRFLFLAREPLSDAVTDRFAEARYLGMREVEAFPDLTRRVYGYLVEDFRGYR